MVLLSAATVHLTVSVHQVSENFDGPLIVALGTPALLYLVSLVQEYSIPQLVVRVGALVCIPALHPLHNISTFTTLALCPKSW